MIPSQSFCCCGQAAEVEKHERLRALASARTPISSIPAPRDRIGGIVTRETTLLNKDIRGPWDGLGVNKRDTVSHEGQQADQAERSQDATSLANSRKRLASSSVQTVVSQRLKIVDVKPDNVYQKTASSIGSVKEGESTTELQWKGLVGYGSEDSDDN